MLGVVICVGKMVAVAEILLRILTGLISQPKQCPK